MNAIEKLDVSCGVAQARSQMFQLGARNIAFAGVLALSMFSSIAAFAGQDTVTPSTQDKGPEATEARQAKPVVLPLDHGPRAETTPWMNKRRLEKIRAERAASAAAEANAANKK